MPLESCGGFSVKLVGVFQLSLWGGGFSSILISLNVVLTYVPLENYDL
jgi:hypothetical protein